ncbi:AraC family ligand binding domain-containing protein [Clostridium magnum]|uniref:AraC family ligand binding domain-containing protein n=1 Tax=Clostridium magnum TaxID=33954 RepID=UPI003BFA7131
MGDTKYHLKKGQGFLIEPDVLTFYQSHSTNPWEYVWVGFSGSDAKQILKKSVLTLITLSLPSKILRLSMRLLKI